MVVLSYTYACFLIFYITVGFFYALVKLFIIYSYFRWQEGDFDNMFMSVKSCMELLKTK